MLRIRGKLDEAEAAYRQAAELGHEPQPGLALSWLARGRTAAAVSAITGCSPRRRAGSADPGCFQLPSRSWWLRASGRGPPVFRGALRDCRIVRQPRSPGDGGVRGSQRQVGLRRD